MNYSLISECEIVDGDKGVHFTYSREGRPSGEAFVELASEDDVTNALAQNNEHIGNRYIEGFTELHLKSSVSILA